MKTKTLSSVLLGFSLLILSKTVFALYPGTVVGIWNVKVNQSSATLNITSQSTSGWCRQIFGNYTYFFDTYMAQGFYCPTTGRIQFLIRNSDFITLLVFSANLASRGNPNYMAGSVASFNDSFFSTVSLGEYSFFASKP